MAKIREIYDNTIKDNGNRQVIYPITKAQAVYTDTNQKIQDLLNEGYRFGGLATPDGVPSVKQRTFYIAVTSGQYTNYGNLTIGDREIAFLLYDGVSWQEISFGDGIVGKSAYESAVDNGFIGTEEEWLESLKATVTLYDETGSSTEGGMTQRAITERFDMVSESLERKQDVIADLETIRSGAAFGSTAIQPTQIDDEDITTDANNLLKFANRPTAVNQMGYVILRKNKTFTEQVTQANTIYEIRYAFDLDENMTLPSNIALLFNGGEIGGNATLTFNETTILGNAKITCGIGGTIFGQVHAEWFGMIAGDPSFDNSPIIQKVCKIFPFVTIEGDEYYCATPIDLYTSALRGLSISADLHYITSGSDTFITIGRPSQLDIRIYGRIIGPVDNNTGGSDRTIGIKFHDMNNSRVYVKTVQRFYTNVQVYSGADGIGNAYNTYEFAELSAANILLELKADNPGWVTSNRFSINRMTTYGGYTSVETAILIHADAVGFSDIVFEKLCIEGVRNSEPVKIINANHVSFYNVRNEDNNANFFYADNVSDIKTRFNYGSPTVRAVPGSICDIIDLNDEYAQYIPLDGAIDVPGGSNRMLLFNAIDSTKAQNVNYSPVTYTPIGFIVPVSRKTLRFSAKDPFDITIVYYDASLNSMSRDAQYMPSGKITFKNSSATSNGYVSTSMNTSQSVALPTLPDGCSYIGYFFRTTKGKANFNGKTPIFSVPSVLAASIIKTMFTFGPRVNHNKYGTTSQRPTFTEDYRQFLVGFEYFDTTLGKPVYAKSIASDGTATWVDATGATV